VALTITKREWLSRALLLLTLGLASPRPAAPQTPPGSSVLSPDLADDPSLTREERIRRHTIRLNQFIAETQARAQAEAAKTAVAQGQAFPPGQAPPGLPGVGVPPVAPSSLIRATPPPMPAPMPAIAVPAAPPPPVPGGPAAQVSFRLSRAIVFFQPFQLLTRSGDDFKTDVRFYNSSGVAVDEIALAIKYDPLVVAPEAVNDSPIYGQIEGAPDLQINRSKGELRYWAHLRESLSKTSTTLVNIRWRALNPIFYTQIVFLTGENGTRIGPGKGTILGFEGAGERAAGILPLSLFVSPRDDSPRKLVPTLAESALARIDERVEVHLEADPERVAKGKEWIVSLMLRNDARLPFNDLRLRILFDPNKLQVVDWHPGNWIRVGTNIFDGFAHATYPFEVHLANSADNETGEISYHVGTQSARYFPSGEFARIKFKTLANASLDDVRFDFEAPQRVEGAVETDVSFLGSSVMFAPRRHSEADERPAPEPLRRPDS
jgi:hypothetical protein